MQSKFKPRDQVRCINNGPLDDGAWCSLILGKEYQIASAGRINCQLSNDVHHYRQDRFKLVTPPPPVYEHEERRYQEESRDVLSNGALSIIAAPMALTRDEIIERAARILRSRLVDSRQLSAFEEGAIELAVASVVDDVMPVADGPVVDRFEPPVTDIGDPPPERGSTS